MQKYYQLPILGTFLGHCKLTILGTLGMLGHPHQNHSIKKITCITHFFLKILRNSILVILGNLGMPVYTNLKWQHQFEETFVVYLPAKIQIHPSRFPRDIAKILQTYCFGYFGHAWLLTPKKILSSCRKILCLPAGKKSTTSPMVFWRYCKNMQNLFWVL